ncbi:tetraspanin-4 isoform 4-T7 [Megaptera novaeangliae]
MARGCLQGVKYLMFAFNLLFWGLQLGCPETGSQEGAGGQQGHPGEERPRCRPTPRPPPALLRQPGPHGAGTAPLGTQLPSSRRAQVVGRFGPGSLGQRCLPLGGCGILGVGIWLAATQGNFATLSSSFPSLSAANLLIVAGTFVMAIGFVGCIGAIKENKCLLLTFFVLLLLVFLLETSLAILFFAYTDKKTLQAHLGGSPPQPWNRPFLQGAWFLYWRTSALRNQDLGALGWQHGAVWVVTDRQVCTAGPEEGPAPVWHPGQRGPHQRLEHHPDRLPLLRGLQLHGLVRGLQRHARARLLLPGVQRELRAACTRHLVEGAVLRDSEGVAPGEPAGRGRLWAVHSTGSDLGPDLRHDDVLPGGEG